MYGKLVAVGVHPDAVRVALERSRSGVLIGRGRLPGRHAPAGRVAAGVVAVLEQRDPVVELAARPASCRARPSGRTSGGTASGSGRARTRPARRARTARGGRCPRPTPARSAARSTAPATTNWTVLASTFSIAIGLPLIVITASGVGHELLVLVHVLEPEHEVVGGERLAVAPLHARARSRSVVTLPSGLTSQPRAMFGTILVPV